MGCPSILMTREGKIMKKYIIGAAIGAILSCFLTYILSTGFNEISFKIVTLKKDKSFYDGLSRIDKKSIDSSKDITNNIICDKLSNNKLLCEMPIDKTGHWININSNKYKS